MKNYGYDDLIDYKFWCFNGYVKFIQIILDRSSKRKDVFYDVNWTKQSFGLSDDLLYRDIEKPDNIDSMINIAQTLAEGFKFVRVDLYHINDGSIYFGEMTFTPNAGLLKWKDDKTDMRLGDLLQI